MSEGEFKKQIRSILGNAVQEGHYPTTEEFNKMFEDAKKALYACKDEQSLRKELVRWFGK